MSGYFATRLEKCPERRGKSHGSKFGSKTRKLILESGETVLLAAHGDGSLAMGVEAPNKIGTNARGGTNNDNCIQDRHIVVGSMFYVAMRELEGRREKEWSGPSGKLTYLYRIPSTKRAYATGIN
jgi:hypothetical protein